MQDVTRRIGSAIDEAELPEGTCLDSVALRAPAVTLSWPPAATDDLQQTAGGLPLQAAHPVASDGRAAGYTGCNDGEGQVVTCQGACQLELRANGGALTVAQLLQGVQAFASAEAGTLQRQAHIVPQGDMGAGATDALHHDAKIDQDAAGTARAGACKFALVDISDVRVLDGLHRVSPAGRQPVVYQVRVIQ
jgi:hypothetical protein